MSANTGFAPAWIMEFAVAAKVKGVVMTSSPFFRPSACRPICRAAVPEETATACCVPM